MIKSDIINNPIQTFNQSNPLDFYLSFANYSARTIYAFNEIKITQEIDTIKFNDSSYIYSQNLFRCSSQVNTYLFADYKLYETFENKNGIISAHLYKQIPDNCIYIGYIKERQFNGTSNKKGHKCGINANEIILYGIKEKSIIFYYIEEEQTYEVVLNSKINTISCKLRDSTFYLCAIDQNDKLYLITLAHIYSDNNIKGLIQKKLIEIPINNTSYNNKAFFYDSQKDHYKLVCSVNKDNYDVSCIIINIGTSLDSDANFKEFDYYISKFSVNEDNCYLAEFNSEFLLCCGMINQISCQRRNLFFEPIKDFNIFFQGKISNLTIINNINYATLQYMNETSDENYLYEYHIYPPKCKNYSKILYVFSEETFILSEKKTNTRYYIKFRNLPLYYGISKLNEIKINSINEEMEMDNELIKFSFASTNNEVIHDFNIEYEISTEESYSVICTISLTIKTCYKSCKTCTVDYVHSSDDQHNCIECDEGYYFFPLQNSNCFTEQEMAITHPDWYLDEENKAFAKCNLECNTCNGPTNEDCLSCNDKYLYNGRCNTECPEKTFESFDNKGNQICENCFETCQSCIERGNSFEMKCLSCSEDDIFYSYDKGNTNNLNCFKSYDAISKTFYNPENNRITNCYELYNKYIIDNSTECIDKPKFGYFISNITTGLLSPCHQLCQMCSKNYTKDNHNCDTCLEGLLFEEGICVESCNEGYFKEGNKCIKCHSDCRTCFNFTENSNMNCILCKDNYYKLNGTNDCYNITSLNKSFYFKENMFYHCDNNCLTCSEGKNEKSNNCLSCDSENKQLFLIEDLNNCEFSNYSGYYLDNVNSILKKCFKNCKTCKGPLEYNSENNKVNHNCIECADNYYKIPYNYYQFYFYNKEAFNSWKKVEETFLNSKDQYDYCNCLESCPDNLFLTSKGYCTPICPNGTYHFYKNHTCLESCPQYYEINKAKKECIIKSFDKTVSSKEFKSQISNNITSYVNSSTLINGSDFIALILTSDDLDPKEQLKKGISAIDLGDCTKSIKDYYNISENESLIILNMESKRNLTKTEEEKNNDNSFNLGKEIQIEVYDKSGRKLDLSVCKEEIKVIKYIGDTEELDIKSAMNLADKGIDVFNASDEFFNDLCKYYDNNDNKDIIIKDRRNDIFQNVSFCQKGCIYDEINYDLMTANCICDPSLIQNSLNNENSNINTNNIKYKEEKLNFNSLKESFIANLLEFNIEVIYCYNLVFNIKILKRNIGFYCLLSMFILQLIFLIVFLVKKLKPLKNYMLFFNFDNKIPIRSFPKQKEQNSNSNINISDMTKGKKIIAKKKKKKKKKQKENGDLINIELNNEDNSLSKRKLFFMGDNENLDYILNNQSNNLPRLMPLFSQEQINNNNYKIYLQQNQEKFIFNNNISQTINIQSPIININNPKEKSNFKKIKSHKKKKKDEINQETTNNNNDKSLKIKSKNKKFLRQERFTKNDILNKKGIIQNKKIHNGKDLINLETMEEKNNCKKNIIGIDVNQDIINLSQTDEDLQDLDYEKAILQDKRTLLRMYWAFLVDSQIILGTFCTENYLNLLVIKLSFFLFTFQISFFLNAFFYTDEYISNAYHNNGVLDFFSGLPKSVYSFVATLITTNLLKMLSNSKSELKKIIVEKRKEDNYIFLINIKLRKLRNKLIIYFFFIFSFGLLFLYYVSAFCSVYRHSQTYWFIGCLESFGIDSLVAVILCIVLAFCRYMAIKKHLKCLFILANIINTFL